MSDKVKDLLGKIFKSSKPAPPEDDDLDGQLDAFLSQADEDELAKTSYSLPSETLKALNHFVYIDPTTKEPKLTDAALEAAKEQLGKNAPPSQPSPPPSQGQEGSGELTPQQWADMNAQFKVDFEKDPVGAQIRLNQWAMEPVFKQFTQMLTTTKDEILQSRDLMDNPQLREEIKRITTERPGVDAVTAKELAQFRLGTNGVQQQGQKPTHVKLSQVAQSGAGTSYGGSSTEEEDDDNHGFTPEEVKFLKDRGISPKEHNFWANTGGRVINGDLVPPKTDINKLYDSLKKKREASQ